MFTKTVLLRILNVIQYRKCPVGHLYHKIATYMGVTPYMSGLSPWVLVIKPLYEVYFNINLVNPFLFNIYEVFQPSLYSNIPFQ